MVADRVGDAGVMRPSEETELPDGSDLKDVTGGVWAGLLLSSRRTEQRIESTMAGRTGQETASRRKSAFLSGNSGLSEEGVSV